MLHSRNSTHVARNKLSIENFGLITSPSMRAMPCKRSAHNKRRTYHKLIINAGKLIGNAENIEQNNGLTHKRNTAYVDQPQS